MYIYYILAIDKLANLNIFINTHYKMTKKVILYVQTQYGK